MSLDEAPPPLSPEPAEDYKDKYFRLLAEVENQRKRMQKEKLDSIKYAQDSIIADFLLPLDSLEGALTVANQMSEEIKNWAYGFQMILGQFKSALEQNGIVPFKSEGELFDPHKHEAIESEEREDVPEGTVLKEFIKGYRSGDRIVRAARVKVCKNNPSNPVKEGEQI